MRIDLHVYLEDSTSLSEVHRKLDQLLQRSRIMAGELDALTAEVARNSDIDNSVIVLVNGLAAKIEELKANPAALQALADSLRASNDAVAAAVAANTPAAPPA